MSDGTTLTCRCPQSVMRFEAHCITIKSIEKQIGLLNVRAPIINNIRWYPRGLQVLTLVRLLRRY